MFCPKCGNETQDGALFCVSCGYSLTDNTGTGELHGYNTTNGQAQNMQTQSGSQMLYGQAQNMQAQSGSQMLYGQAQNMQAQSESQMLYGQAQNTQAHGGSQVLGAQALYAQKLNSLVSNNMGKARGIDIKCLDVKLSIVGAAFWFLSAFLPFASVNFLGTVASKSLIDGGDGWFVIIFAVGVVAALYFHKNIARNIFVALGVIVNLIDMDVSDSDEMVSAFIQKRAGYYFLIIGSVLLVISIIVYYVRRKNSA